MPSENQFFFALEILNFHLPCDSAHVHALLDVICSECHCWILSRYLLVKLNCYFHFKFNIFTIFLYTSSNYAFYGGELSICSLWCNVERETYWERDFFRGREKLLKRIRNFKTYFLGETSWKMEQIIFL